MELLKRTEFGNPILRQIARPLTVNEAKSPKIKKLITNMRHTLMTKKLGVGLAAPQVGEGIALAILAVRATPTRPDVEPFDLVMINPEITRFIGRRKAMWEGCLSAGKATLFAQVPRYNKIEAAFMDEHGKRQRQMFDGLRAQIVQHETDHLNGILFVDRVTDTTSYMTLSEYKKMKRNSQPANQKKPS